MLGGGVPFHPVGEQRERLRLMRTEHNKKAKDPLDEQGRGGGSMIENKLKISHRAAVVNHWLEEMTNKVVRSYDGVMGMVRLGGRKAKYDDSNYEFIGGPRDRLRARHYDKSLRLLWKAEEHAPWSSFRDCTSVERAVLEQALKTMTKEEQDARRRLVSKEFKELLDESYTRREKEAIVSILSAIGHGEAYAWLVSAELLGEVQSTGGKAACTLQVLEEAKHFVVLRELLQAFDVPIPRQSAWEYLLLEQVFKADGLEKFFGMNVLVEGIALSIFGMLSEMPGLDILRLFHLDESRHTALPMNYFKEFPLSVWQKHNPVARLGRLKLVLPAVPLIFLLEEDLAELGIDVFEFGGSVLRKIGYLAERAGFYLPIPSWLFVSLLNSLFNVYCRATRPDYEYRNYAVAETTRGKREQEVEAEIFGAPA